MGSNHSTPLNNLAEPTDDDVSKASNKFTNKIYSHLAAASSFREKNIVLSGLSISSVMAMLLLGANGDTAKEIQDCFCFPKGAIQIIRDTFSALSRPPPNVTCFFNLY
jgi:serine protease inhibitor